MKPKAILILLAVAAVIGGLIFAKRANDKTAAPDSSAEAAAPSDHVQAAANTVVLNEETQRRIGLSTGRLTLTNFNREMKGYGRVLDPGPLAALANDLASAQIAATGSRQEFDRLKVLGENASVKALQIAEGTLRRDEFAVRGVENKLKSGWGNALAAQENLSEFLKPFVAGQKILVRLFLPASETLPSNPASATLTSLAGAKPLQAVFLEALPQLDEQTQGQGFLFVADGRSDFRPGAAVTGTMPVTGEARTGVVVPHSAVVRHEAKAWVYLKTNEDHFVRREVSLEIPAASGWFVPDLGTNNEVVLRGAQILLSEEGKDRNQSGD